MFSPSIDEHHDREIPPKKFVPLAQVYPNHSIDYISNGILQSRILDQLKTTAQNSVNIQA